MLRSRASVFSSALDMLFRSGLSDFLDEPPDEALEAAVRAAERSADLARRASLARVSAYRGCGGRSPRCGAARPSGR